MHKKTRNLIINGIIAILLYVVISNLTPPDPITPVGMKILGIVVGMIYGLITIDAVIPSIAALILMGFTGYTGSIQTTVMAASGGFVACMVLTLMLFSGVLTKCGLAKYLAEKIVYSKLANGKPWVLTALIMVASWFPSMFLTSIPVIIIMWGIVKSIFEVAGFKKGEKWPTIMMIMVVFCALIGMTCMPFNVGVAGDFAILLALDATQVVPVGPFIVSSLTLAIFILIITFLIIRFILKPDVSKLKNYKTCKDCVKTDTDQKRGIALLILLIALMLAPDILPAGGLHDFLANFGAAGASLVVVLIAICIRNKDGSPFMTFTDITTNGIFWPMLVMIAAINVACGGLSSPDLGIVTFLQNFLSPLVEGLTPFGFFALLVLVAYIITNIFDGAVVAYITIPILYVLGPAAGLTATALMAVMTHNVQSGLILPSSSPSSAMMYGEVEGGWYTRKECVKYGSICALVYLVSMIIVYFPFLGSM